MTELTPVAEWTWNLYRVRYTRDEAGRELVRETWMVETAVHVDGEVEWQCPDGTWYHWELVREDVPALPPVGVMYGVPIHGSSEVGPDYGS